MAEVTLLNEISSISAAQWDALAAPEQAVGRPFDPFTTHRFLHALEASRSTGAQTGWEARPLVLRDAEAGDARGNDTGGRDAGGRIIAATPLYVKSHSQGEYIFDQGWAEAYERAGGSYYPKLQIAVPFTPATGRRFLGDESARKTLLRGAISLARQNQLSSLHVTFCTQSEANDLAGVEGCLHRVTQQFHWENRDYVDFEGFLADLSSRKRKTIRKERATAQAAGLEIRTLSGDDITPAHWEAFWAFYQDTGARKWGRPYLTRDAFTQFHETMRDDILLILAFDGARPIAGALNFIGKEVLYGRYWGCAHDIPCLHFELCYYRAMEWAIANGLKWVEAGAQGVHKLARGYLPQTIHSLHWIADEGFRDAVANYLEAERRAVGEEMSALNAYAPFRRGGSLRNAT